MFDTAPTGHTLRLLTVPDFVEASLGKLIRLRKKLAAAGGAVRGLFGASEQQDEAVAKLEALKVRRQAQGRRINGRLFLSCAGGDGALQSCAFGSCLYNAPTCCVLVRLECA